MAPLLQGRSASEIFKRQFNDLPVGHPLIENTFLFPGRLFRGLGRSGLLHGKARQKDGKGGRNRAGRAPESVVAQSKHQHRREKRNPRQNPGCPNALPVLAPQAQINHDKDQREAHQHRQSCKNIGRRSEQGFYISSR